MPILSEVQLHLVHFCKAVSYPPALRLLNVGVVIDQRGGQIYYSSTLLYKGSDGHTLVPRFIRISPPWKYTIPLWGLANTMPALDIVLDQRSIATVLCDENDHQSSFILTLP